MTDTVNIFYTKHSFLSSPTPQNATSCLSRGVIKERDERDRWIDPLPPKSNS